MHTRNHQPAPALCASVALVAASSTLANLATSAMFARTLLGDRPGESPTMPTHQGLLATNNLPHHPLGAVFHQPGRDLVLVDSTFDNGAMTLLDNDDRGCDPSAICAKPGTIFNWQPSAMMTSTVHNDQGTFDSNGGGGSIDPGEHRMNETRHLHDLRADRRRYQPGAFQHHATRPDARLLN